MKYLLDDKTCILGNRKFSYFSTTNLITKWNSRTGISVTSPGLSPNVCFLFQTREEAKIVEKVLKYYNYKVFLILNNPGIENPGPRVWYFPHTIKYSPEGYFRSFYSLEILEPDISGFKRVFEDLRDLRFCTRYEINWPSGRDVILA